MRTYQNSAQAGNSPDKELNYLVSDTVPDQGMTVRTILERFASGTLSDVNYQMEFSEDNEDLRGLDISQRYDMEKQAKRDAIEIAERIKEEAQEARRNKEKSSKTDPEITEAEITE